MTTNTDLVIGIRFTRLGKIYHFKANDDRDIVIGDIVLVETSRGYQLGKVVQFVEDVTTLEHPNVKSIIRKANEEDVAAQHKWIEKEEAVLSKARETLPTKGENAVKVVHAEYGYMGESLSILVSSIGEHKVNLNPIRNRLENAFPDTKVNVRQIGPRDVAKLYGGIGACGLPERCCTQFLDGFNSISIRMAKEQEISLTPEEITGMCGRLRCCLNYEYEQYREGRKGLPKKGKWVETPDGVGRVTVVLPLRGTILVSFYGGGLHEYAGEDVKITSRPQRPEQGKERSYNRPSTPRSSRNEKQTDIIPEHQLEELNAEAIDINSGTTPVKPEQKRSNNSNRSRSKKNNSRRRRNIKGRNRSNKSSNSNQRNRNNNSNNNQSSNQNNPKPKQD